MVNWQLLLDLWITFFPFPCFQTDILRVFFYFLTTNTFLKRSVRAIQGVKSNVNSWKERAIMRSGHKVKQIMFMQYWAVLHFFSTVPLFVCLFSNHSFHSLAISTHCSAVVAGHRSGRGEDHCGQGHVRQPVTLLSALMHSGQSYTVFHVCRGLQRQHIVSKSNLVLKDDLDTWLHQKKTRES